MVHGSIRDAHDLRKDPNLNKVIKEHTEALRKDLAVSRQIFILQKGPEYPE